MAWIESHQNLERHPKRVDLSARMKWTKPETIGRLHLLWWWSLDFAEDGDLRKYNDDQIAEAMCVDIGHAGDLVEALVQARWLEREPYFRIRNWWSYIGRFLHVKYGKSDPDRIKRIKSAYAVTVTDTATVTVTALTKPNLTNQPEGERAREDGVSANCPEIPTLETALAQCSAAMIAPDFASYVFDDWTSRSGKDGGGNVVEWLPYVSKRWSREQVEWRAGTHRGKKAVKAKPARPEGVPDRAEVMAYAKEKYGDDPKHLNWGSSFYSAWSGRDWKRQGRLIDWKPEFTSQVAKWRAEQ